MSSAVVSTTAALGRHFVFDDEAESGSLPGGSQKRRASLPAARILPSSVTPASQLTIRPAPEMVSSGIAALDALTGGLPRGCLTEICGPASSGRTTLLLAALATATRRGEFCAVVDASDAFDPQSAADAGVELDRLLWVRCGEDHPQKSHARQGSPAARASLTRAADGSSQSAFDFNRAWNENGSRQSEYRLEQVLRATDLLLESGGFGLIALDLADLPPQAARRIPLTTWFRFRRAVENKPTILLAIEQQAIAGSCSSLLLQLGGTRESGAVPCATHVPSAIPPALTCRGNESRRFATGAVAYDASNSEPSARPAHTHLLTGLEINAELIRSRLERKPARAVTFATQTAWAG